MLQTIAGGQGDEAAGGIVSRTLHAARLWPYPAAQTAAVAGARQGI